MSAAAHEITVTTIAGLTLRLTVSNHDGWVHATLQVPEHNAEPGTVTWQRTAAFLAGGKIGRDVHIDPRTSRHQPPVLWLQGAAVDLSDDTAATAQAWLDSHAAASTAHATSDASDTHAQGGAA